MSTLEEVWESVFLKMCKIEESSPAFDSAVALCGGETDRLKMATIIAKSVWEKEEATRKLAQFAPSKEELAKIVKVAGLPAEESLAEQITKHMGFMEQGYANFHTLKLMWNNHRSNIQVINLDSLETYAEIYEGYARKLARMILQYKCETKQ